MKNIKNKLFSFITLMALGMTIQPAFGMEKKSIMTTDQDPKFFKAIYEGNLDTVKNMIETSLPHIKSMLLTKENTQFKRNVISYAFTHKKQEVFKYLSELSLSFAEKKLFEAITNGDYATFKYILEHPSDFGGLNILAKDCDEKTFLGCAIECSREQMVEDLITKDNKLIHTSNSINTYGVVRPLSKIDTSKPVYIMEDSRPLSIMIRKYIDAIKNNHDVTNIIKIIRHLTAKKEFMFDSEKTIVSSNDFHAHIEKQYYKLSPLDNLITNFGYDSRANTLIHHLVSCGANINTVDMSALHKLCKAKIKDSKDCTDMISQIIYLVSLGADIDLPNFENRTLLDVLRIQSRNNPNAAELLKFCEAYFKYVRNYYNNFTITTNPTLPNHDKANIYLPLAIIKERSFDIINFINMLEDKKDWLNGYLLLAEINKKPVSIHEMAWAKVLCGVVNRTNVHENKALMQHNALYIKNREIFTDAHFAFLNMPSALINKDIKKRGIDAVVTAASTSKKTKHDDN